MPKVLRQNEVGYDFYIYYNDHAPPHAHVIKDDAAAMVALQDIEILQNSGFNTKDLNRILKITEENQDYLIEKWNEYNPDNPA